MLDLISSELAMVSGAGECSLKIDCYMALPEGGTFKQTSYYPGDCKFLSRKLNEGFFEKINQTMTDLGATFEYELLNAPK